MQFIELSKLSLSFPFASGVSLGLDGQEEFGGLEFTLTILFCLVTVTGCVLLGFEHQDTPGQGSGDCGSRKNPVSIKPFTAKHRHHCLPGV